MNKKTIERIISNLDEQGYTIRKKEIKEESIIAHYEDCEFEFWFENGSLKVDVTLRFDYRLTFDQENVDYINSITKYWSIYKHFINLTYRPKNEKELENTLKKLLETYN